jgi:hypothetical protein
MAADRTRTSAAAANFGLFAVMVVLMTIPFSFVFNRTGGSVFVTGPLHTAIDTPQLVWLPLLLPVGAANSASGEGRLDLAVLLAFGAVALLIVALTRGRLGWNRETTAAAPETDPQRSPTPRAHR